MRRLDNEKVIDYLSTLGLSAKDKISGESLQEKYDKYEKLYNPDNEQTGNPVKYAELLEAYAFLRNNIFNVNLLIENDFNQDDYYLALQHVEEKQREFKEIEAERLMHREDTQVQESILRAREAVAIEEAQEFYHAELDKESEPFLLSYSDYTKKGNKKIKAIIESYKNVNTIRTRSDAESKISELKEDLGNVLKRKEEKSLTSKVVFAAVLLIIFIAIPIILYSVNLSYGKNRYDTATAQLLSNNFSEAQRHYTAAYQEYGIDTEKELKICDGLILINQSKSNKDMAYLRDGIDRLTDCGVNVNVTYVYSKCKIKSLITDKKYQDTITKEGTSLYNPGDIKGYKFDGWTTYGLTYTGEANVKLEANLTPIEYTITYNSAFSSTNNPAKYTIEDTIILTPPTETTNWYDKEGNIVTKIVPGTTGDIVLYPYNPTQSYSHHVPIAN